MPEHQVQAAAPTAAETTATPTRMRVWLAAIISFTLFVAYLDRVNVSVLLASPHFLEEMGLRNNPVGQGLVMTLFLITYGIGNVLLSPIGDRLGPRKTMLLSIAWWIVPVLMGGMARTVGMLYLSRLLLGAGEGVHMPTLVSFVKNWFPQHERGKANSAWLFGLMVGPGIAMPLFAVVVASLGWRASFWLCALLGVVALPLVWFFTADYPAQHKFVNRTELEYIVDGQEADKAHKGKVDATTTPWQSFLLLIKNPDFCVCTFSCCASLSMWWGILSWLPQYLRVARGFSWAKTGFFSSLPFALGILGLLCAGVVADKLKKTAVINCIGLGGCALFILLGALVHNAYLSACLIAVALFFKGVCVPMAWTLLQTFVPANIMNQAAGLQNGSSQLVASLSPVAVGFLIGSSGNYAAGLMYLVVFGFFGMAAGFYLVIKGY